MIIASLLVAANLRSKPPVVVFSDDNGAIGTYNCYIPAVSHYLNHFVARAGGETVTSVLVCYDLKYLTGTELTLSIWLDPDGDGTPNDAAVVKESITDTKLRQTKKNEFARYKLKKPIHLSEGQSFFAGVRARGFIGADASAKGVGSFCVTPKDAVHAKGDDIFTVGEVIDLVKTRTFKTWAIRVEATK